MDLVPIPEAPTTVVNAFKRREPGSLDNPLAESLQLIDTRDGSYLIKQQQGQQKEKKKK